MVESKQDILLRLHESDFQRDVVIPLLKNLGYTNVRLRHGPNEYGKDIICQFQTPLSRLNVAVVVKRGHLSAAISPKTTAKKPVNKLADVREQVHQAFNIPIDDASDSSQTSVNSVMVWISGNMRSNVHHQVVHDLGNNYANVQFKDGPATVELLDDIYPQYWTIGDYSLSTYFSNARAKYSQLQELLALGLRDSTRQLPSVFVEPRIELRERVRSKQAIKEQLPRKRYQLSKLLDGHPQKIALIGGMGSGKSTALRRLLLSTLDNNEKEVKKYPIPIYIRFRDLDLQHANSIREGLAKEFEQLAASEQSTDLDGLLDEGKIIVLLDGLDELETEENITKGMQALLDFVDTNNSSRVIFSTRSLEILKSSKLLSKFTVYRMLHLDFQQIQTLIKKWFENSDKDGEALIKLVSNPVTFSSLPHTPLTLALLAVIYDRGIQDLPANLTELLEKYVEIALGRWDMDKGIQQQIEWRIKQNLLGQLAWSLVQNNEFSVSLTQITELVEAQRAEIGLTYDSNSIVKEIVERSGLLVPRGDDLFAFKHHSFLSYFAGHELSLQPNSRELVVSNFYDFAWQRIIFFTCGIKRDDRSFLQSIADKLVIPEDNLLVFAMQLGLVTQASFLTPLSVKVNLVKRAIVSAVFAWDEITLRLQETNGSEDKRRQIRQVVLLDFISAHITLGLGSPILRPPLEEIVREILSRPQSIKDESDAEIGEVQAEWYVFFLALACIEAEAIDSFVDLLSANTIRNPMLLAFCEFQADFMLEVGTYSAEDRGKLEDLVKRSRRRLKGMGKQINELFDVPPNPIRMLASRSGASEPDSSPSVD